MNLRRKLLLASVAAGLVSLAPAGAMAQANAPFRIGTILSVTGPGAFLGDHMKRGMELAIDEINPRAASTAARSSGCSTTPRRRRARRSPRCAA